MTEGLEKLIREKTQQAGIASPEVALAKALFINKKYDYNGETRLFICEGLWAGEKLISGGITVTHFLFCPDRAPEKDGKVLSDIIKYSEKSFVISEKACDKISDRDGSDYCFIIARMPVFSLEDIDIPDETVCMILDGQEQPGNVGAILRSSDGAGSTFAVVTNQRVKLTHSRLVRASLGAVFTMKVAEASERETAEWLVKNGFKIVVTDLKAKFQYYDADYSGRVAIVAGNEYNGVSPKWNTLPGALPVIIPMMGSCESLNVGFASTLVAYEASIQQKKLRK